MQTPQIFVVGSKDKIPQLNASKRLIANASQAETSSPLNNRNGENDLREKMNSRLLPALEPNSLEVVVPSICSILNGSVTRTTPGQLLDGSKNAPRLARAEPLALQGGSSGSGSSNFN